MELNITIIISLITALGIGGAVGAYFQARFNQKAKIDEKQQELKQNRYLAILIQMLTKLNPSKLSKIKKFRPDLITVEDLDTELFTEFLHAFVFADDQVVISLGKFIENPNYKNYTQTAIAMRKDLWGKTSQIDENLLNEYTFLEKLLKE